MVVPGGYVPHQELSTGACSPPPEYDSASLYGQGSIAALVAAFRSDRQWRMSPRTGIGTDRR